MATDGTRRWVFDLLWLLAWGVASSAWCVTAARQVGVTFDEPVYLERGLNFWRTGSHRGLMQLGTMPLPIDVETFPLYLWERWNGTPWNVLDDMERILPTARAGTLVFWWLLLLYGGLAGRQIAGPWGGRLAVALLACEPSLLAHAGLATTDVAVSACLLALLYHFRVGRDAGWFGRVAVPAAWYGAAVLAKASGLVFGPLCLLMVELARLGKPGDFAAGSWSVVRGLWSRRGRTPGPAPEGEGQARRFWGDLAWVMAGGLALVFAYCGCDWEPEPSFVAWAHRLPDGAPGRSLAWLADHLTIFSNAGEGIVRQVRHNVRGHGAFLLGAWQPRAFWYYFPVALSIKLSLPLLLAPLLVALVRPRALANWACAAAAALLVFSLNCRVQIGIRLVLPLIVLAVIGVAAAVVNAYRREAADPAAPGRLEFRLRPLLLLGPCLAVAWTAWSALAVWPHGLCYTNELWGGTAQGYRYLSDSNYDWGQGLRELADWQRRHGGQPLDVWYFGTDPLLRQLPARPLPLHALPAADDRAVQEWVRGRYLAASTTLLYGCLLGKDVGPHRRAIEFLRRHTPVDRTTTFLIFDFGREGEGAERVSRP